MVKKLALVSWSEFERGDKGVGVMVTTKAKELAIPALDVLDLGSNFMGLLEILKSHAKVYVIDSAKSGNMIGSITTYRGTDPHYKDRWIRASAHSDMVKSVLEMAEALGIKQKGLVVFSIEGRNFELGQKMTKEVRKSAEHLVNMIQEEFVK